MHAKAAAALRYADQRIQELGQFSGQRGELVHYHHQTRQRIIKLGASSPKRCQILSTNSS